MEFGHRHLGLFYRPLLNLQDDGFIYQGNSYSWSDIEMIKRYDNYFWSMGLSSAGAPFTYVYLNDGKTFKIRGASIERKDSVESRKRSRRGMTKAYTELIETIEKQKDAV